jgi:hypothetical protein
MNDEALPRVWVSFDLVARERDKVVFDPDYVTEALGVEPTQQNRAGDSIRDGEGRRTFTRWRVSVGPVETITIGTMLDEVISRLRSVGDNLRAVCDEIGVEPVLICAVEPRSAQTPAIRFPVEIVRWAADNRVALDVDIMLWRKDDQADVD